MDGMHYFTGLAVNGGGDFYVVTDHWEVPPLNCIVQTQITCIDELDDQSRATIALTSADYLDSTNARHHDDYTDRVTSVSYPRLVSFDWQLVIINAAVNFNMNVFEWGANV